MVMMISMEQCWDGSGSEEPKYRWWEENLIPCPLSSTVSHGLYGDWTRASAVRGMQVHLTRTEAAVHIIRYIRWNTY